MQRTGEKTSHYDGWLLFLQLTRQDKSSKCMSGVSQWAHGRKRIGLPVFLVVFAAGAAAALVVALENKVSWCYSDEEREGAHLAQRFQTLLLGMGVDVGSDEEADDVEERHPGVLGQELLGKGQGQRGGDPADLHDGHEAGLDGGADLVDGAGAGDDGHGGEVDAVLDGGDEQVADEDLQDLGLEAGAAGKDLLQDADEEVAERGADEHAVEEHLGDAGAEVVAVFADVVGDPGGEELLEAGEDAGGEHLGAQRVGLQMLEIELWGLARWTGVERDWRWGGSRHTAR